MEVTSNDVKAFFTSIFSWVVIPALVVYGYYYGNEASQYIVIFYMWMIFVLQFFVGGFLILMLGLVGDEIDLNEDTLKDKKKIDAILKWNVKLKSKFHAFKMTISTILYFGLAILIASTGAVWTAFIFTLTFVVFKYIFMEIVKHLYEMIVPQVKAAAEKLQVDEILDIVGKGESKK